MEPYFFADLSMDHVDDAAAHYHEYDCSVSIMPGIGAFHYSKRFCMLGSSFVSVSLSQSGWGYELTNELDSFVITIPHTGYTQWKTNSGSYQLSTGQAVLVDQKEVISALHSEGTFYTTVYISGLDMVKYLTMFLGRPPKKRIVFKDVEIEPHKARFINSLVETIFCLSGNNYLALSSVAADLKECLIGYMLHNIPNNYIGVLFDEGVNVIPTPYCIKAATQYMQDNTDPHLTVGEVAIHAGISVRSLQSGFKRYKNTTPIAFLREIRLEKARELLKKSACSDKEVAVQCGFSNYQMFCKYYIRKFGEHPKLSRYGI